MIGRLGSGQGSGWVVLAEISSAGSVSAMAIRLLARLVSWWSTALTTARAAEATCPGTGVTARLAGADAATAQAGVRTILFVDDRPGRIRPANGFD
jgi:hypothetical protein